MATPPEIPSDFDFAELLACARYGELDELKELVTSYSSKPASDLLALSSPDVHGSATALHMAAANGHTEVVAYLVETLPKQALNARNEGGNTPLHWACLNGHKDAVELLLKAGADPKPLNNARRDPLYEAEAKEFEEIATLLVKYGAVEDAVGAGAGEEAGPSGPAEEEVEGGDEEDGDETMEEANGTAI